MSRAAIEKHLTEINTLVEQGKLADAYTAIGFVFTMYEATSEDLKLFLSSTSITKLRAYARSMQR